MKAVMIDGEWGKLTLGELPIPEPGEYEALVRMEACSICNSTDQKLLNGEFYPGELPEVLGHEVVSTVVKLGPKVENYKVGDRVFRQRLWDSHVPGGSSRWGAFSEYGIVTDEWAKQGVPYGPDPLPHDQQKLMIDVDPAPATAMVTLMETLDCAYVCGVEAGKSVAIVGTGPVAQAVSLFSNLIGAKPVIVFGRRAEHEERFKTICRADQYIVGDAYTDEVKQIVADGGFDVVIEAVGSIEALDRSIELAGEKSNVGVYGIAPGSNNYREDQMSRPGVRRIGVKEGKRQAELVKWIESGDVKLTDWISHCLPMSQYREAFDLVINKKAMKVVMLPDKDGE